MKTQLAWAGSPMDRWLLALALAAVTVLWWQVAKLTGRGEPVVTIWHDHTLLARYPLNAAKPVELVAHGPLGETLVRIADGKVRILRSPCRSQRCLRSGSRQSVGGVLACVPNHILVSIEGNDGDAALDAMAE